MLRGQEELRCGCGRVASTVEGPTGVCATAVSKSIMLCCSSTAVDNSPVVRAAPILSSKWTDARCRDGKKKYL